MLLKTFSEISRLQRQATIWEHDAIQVTSRMTPRTQGKRNKTEKGKRSDRRAFSKKESDVYKLEDTVRNEPVTPSRCCSPLVFLFLLTSGKGMPKCRRK